MNLTSNGSDAFLGMKAFHVHALGRCGGRSCVQCHWLPEGSNNRITEAPVGGLETAAIRSLFSREGRAEKPASVGPIGESNVMTTHFGLVHDGHEHQFPNSYPPPSPVDLGPASIDRFILDSFGVSQANYPLFEAIAKFCREMDAGIAPSVGVTYTVTLANRLWAGHDRGDLRRRHDAGGRWRLLHLRRHVAGRARRRPAEVRWRRRRHADLRAARRPANGKRPAVAE
jgi:hypothetical protein